MITMKVVEVSITWLWIADLTTPTMATMINPDIDRVITFLAGTQYHIRRKAGLCELLDEYGLEAKED